MIKIIYGSKGTGKTKIIINEANATKDVQHAIFITDTDRYMYEIKSEVRFVNAKDAKISTLDSFIGFIKGMLAGNYDITNIYIDGATRLCNLEINDMENFYLVLDDIAKNSEVQFIITVSKDKKELPKFISKYLGE